MRGRYNIRDCTIIAPGSPSPSASVNADRSTLGERSSHTCLFWGRRGWGGVGWEGGMKGGWWRVGCTSRDCITVAISKPGPPTDFNCSNCRPQRSRTLAF